MRPLECKQRALEVRHNVVGSSIDLAYLVPRELSEIVRHELLNIAGAMPVSAMHISVALELSTQLRARDFHKPVAVDFCLLIADMDAFQV